MENKLKEKIARGETGYGVLLAWPCPELAEFFGYLGFDWAFIDAEHGAFSLEACANMVRACKVGGLTPLVRVPENNPATILGFLETGMLGVIVPHISNADDARRAVSAARYAPLGQRSAGSTSPLSWYGTREPSHDYIRRANDEIIVSFVVEDREGLENLDEILAVEGYDTIDIGPGDLAMSLGYPGRPDHPDVQGPLQEGYAKIAAANRMRTTFVSATSLLADAGRRYLASQQ